MQIYIYIYISIDKLEWIGKLDRIIMYYIRDQNKKEIICFFKFSSLSIISIYFFDQFLRGVHRHCWRTLLNIEFENSLIWNGCWDRVG